METIQPFIDLGWHTVPLKGELKRHADGTKTIPQFEKNWKNKYQQAYNTAGSQLGGAITGDISGIIAIDCDSQATYNMFKTLDPEYDFHFISYGKPKGGGTIIYKYPANITLPSFSIQDELTNLDFYSDNGFVYLPTDANETKKAWQAETLKDLPKLKQMPASVLMLLQVLHKQYAISKSGSVDTTKVATANYSYLAPQIELFIAKEQFTPQLFKILTPKDFRDLEQYIRVGYLHPENVPEGRGSEYLSKVSAILGADASISKELYTKALQLINSMWPEPMAHTRLKATIIDPMLNGQAQINGEPLWRYDEHWADQGVMYTTKTGDAVECFYDDIRMILYLINNSTGRAVPFYKEAELLSHIGITAVNAPPRKEVLRLLPLVQTVTRPNLPFGYIETEHNTKEFNLFRQTPALAVLANPEKYAELYKTPTVTLKFLEAFVPDIGMREYLLKFLRHKFTTFKYTPVVLYFLGVHGSGKDTLVKLLETILGGSHIAKPTAKEFLEHYNSWMLDKYFVHLDEYGNQLVRVAEKQEALGKIKAYSGKEEIQIRQMRTDGYNYKHSSTFIMTANNNPLLIEDGDRRVALFDTPNKLIEQNWIELYGGIQTVIDTIMSEANDFCYYLATEVPEITASEYTLPPATKEKHHLILDKLTAGPKLAYMIKHDLIEALEDTAEDHGMTEEIFEGSNQGRIYEDSLLALYLSMTNHAGTQSQLTAVFRANEVEKVPTTREGKKAYYYSMPGLKAVGDFAKINSSRVI